MHNLMTIPFSKSIVKPDEIEAVLSALNGLKENGSHVTRLEEQFAHWMGANHAVATSSGTGALTVALLAHGVGVGDEVITTPFTSIATINAVLATGAKPVFVDIETVTKTMDVTRLEDAITSRSRAILPVHLFGHMCDMEALERVARQHNLVVVEDACQALGALCHGRMAGSFGTGVFRFSTGEGEYTLSGGVITTNDDKIAERCRAIRDHGLDESGEMVAVGLQFGMPETHAALFISQFARLEKSVQQRRKNAIYLNAHLTAVETPVEKAGFQHVWSKYTVCLKEGADRQAALNQLRAVGIEARVYYPKPVYHYSHVRKAVGDVHCPVAEQASQRVLSLPVHPLLVQEDLKKIVFEVNRLA
jgi:dTDP-4-amino-4,6-dideoxygalactose transaminase